MPELPEVETVVRELSRYIVGQKIKSVEILSARSFLWNPKITRPKKVGGKTVFPVPKEILGRTIKTTSRRGKGIIIDLDKGYSILIHLKMTGQLIYIPHSRHAELVSASRSKILKRVQDDKPEKGRLNLGHPDANFLESMPSSHTRVIFELTHGTLYFNNQRKFGWVKLTPTKDIFADKFFAGLGPEPFDKSFTAKYLWDICQRRPKSNIKSIILDQKMVSGVGNIYSDEALFYAHIKPTRKGKDISKTDASKLRSAILKVLKLGIKYSGTSISHHRTPEGATGKMQNHLAVYEREGEPCKFGCKGTVKRIKLGGRSARYCPVCQI